VEVATNADRIVLEEEDESVVSCDESVASADKEEAEDVSEDSGWFTCSEVEHSCDDCALGSTRIEDFLKTVGDLSICEIDILDADRAEDEDGLEEGCE
jgi:hypothetical protein